MSFRDLLTITTFLFALLAFGMTLHTRALCRRAQDPHTPTVTLREDGSIHIDKLEPGQSVRIPFPIPPS
jgi:hypothetical protein